VKSTGTANVCPGGEIGSVSGTKDWTYVERIISVDPKMDQIRIYIGLPSSATGRAWFDDLSVEPLKEGEPIKSGNLLRNSSFAECNNPGIPNWWGIPLATSLYIKDWDGSYYGLDSSMESPVKGTRVLRVRNPLDNFEFPVFTSNYLNIPPLPDGEYTFSVYLKSDRQGLPIAFCDTQWGSQASFITNKDWQRYTATFTEKGNARAYMKLALNSPGTLWVAAPQLEMGNHATEYKMASGESTAASQNSPTPADSKLPVANCPKVAHAPVMDGTLNDPVWRNAWQSSQFTLLRGGMPSQQTTCLLLRDDSTLYVGFRCKESSIEQLKLQAVGHDSNVFDDDSVELFLQPDSTDGAYYHFAATLSGAMWEDANKDSLWNTAWTCKGSKGSGEWTAEMSIPFSSLPALGKGPWRMQLCRNRYAGGASEHSSWSPLIAVSSSFHSAEYFGFMEGINNKDLAAYNWRIGNIRLTEGDNNTLTLSAGITKWPASTESVIVRAGLLNGRESEETVKISSKSLSIPVEIAGIVVGNLEPVRRMQDVQISLLDSSSKRVLKSFIATLPVVKKYSLSAAFEYSYYTDDGYARLKARWSAGKTADLNLKLMNVSNGKEINSRLLSVSAEGDKIFSIPLTAMPAGEYDASVTLVSKGVILAETKDKLVKIPPRDNEVRINRFTRGLSLKHSPYWANMLVLEDAAYRMNEEWQWRDIKDHGINTVICTNVLRSVDDLNRKEQAIRAYLDECRANGLKVVFMFEPSIQQKTIEEIIKIEQTCIERFKDHPAILAWWIIDEPSRAVWERAGKTEKDLTTIYKAAKAADPYHPAITNWCESWKEGYEPYGTLACTDIVSYDYYPFRSFGEPKAIENMAEYSSMINSFGNMSKPSLMVIQSYGCGDAIYEPTPPVLRCQAYMNVISGCRMVAYYACKPVYTPLWGEMGKVNKEWMFLSKELFFAPDAEKLIQGNLDKVLYTVWKKGNTAYLIVANYDKTQKMFNLSDISALTGKKYTKCDPVFGNKCLRVENNNITGTLLPLQAGAYKLY
jgi:hypothetical protein